MKSIKTKHSKDISVIQGGYSDVRLWPCYMIYSSLMLFFTPIIGMTLAFLIFSAIGLRIALYAAKKIPKETYAYDTDAWYEDRLRAITNGEPIPDLFSYRIAVPAEIQPEPQNVAVATKTTKPKKITTKKQALWPYLDLTVVKS